MDLARIASIISASSGKRPLACFEKISVPLTVTSNTPRSPRVKCASMPSSRLSVAARLEALGR